MKLTFKSLIEFVHKVNSDESGNPDPYIPSLNSVVRNNRLPGLDPAQRDTLLNGLIEELKGKQGVISPELRQPTAEGTWLGQLRLYVDLAKLQEIFKNKKIPSLNVIAAEILVDSPAWAVESHPYLMREIPARVVRALEEMGLQKPGPGRPPNRLIKKQRKLVQEHIRKYQDFFTPTIKNQLNCRDASVTDH